MGVTFQDYYEILGVPRTATDKEIKSAYRKMARKYHPDLHSGKEKDAAEDKFKQINEAYNVLSDPEKREKYDRLGANWKAGDEFRAPPGADGYYYSYDPQGGPGGFGGFAGAEGFGGGDFGGGGYSAGGFSDFFEALFGGRFRPAGAAAGAGPWAGFASGATGQGARGRPLRGPDVEAKLDITLEEAYRGAEKLLRLTAREACAACGGTGIAGNAFCPRCGGTGSTGRAKSLAVKIPAGVRDGSRIRLKGLGGEGLQGGPKGDLYVTIGLLPHPVFKVRDNDLETEIVIRPEEAVLGSQVEVPTLDGPVRMKVPPGTKAGRKLRLKGKGLPGQKTQAGPDNQGERGDQYVVIIIDIPDHISQEEQDLYRRLAELKKGAGHHGP